MKASEARILDATCGGRMFWFDKADPRALFVDNRMVETALGDGRVFAVQPDIIADFRDLPFPDNTFHLVVFDPPHLRWAGRHSDLAIKYCALGADWQDDIKRGFAECFRVLRLHGILIFKWAESQIPVRDVLALTEEKPLFGNRNLHGKTHWIVFMKEKEEPQREAE